MKMYKFDYDQSELLYMNLHISENVSLAPKCSMRAGGSTKYLVSPKTVSELTEAVKYFEENKEKYIVVGNCSNLIFPDGTYDGAVIITTELRGIALENGIITALCGETLSSLARFACENSLSGLEFCYGIPGTVGGAVFMNAGAYGGEISQRFISGEFLDEDLKIITLTAEEMKFSYRKSIMSGRKLILLSASFSAVLSDKGEIRAKMDELMASRKAKQPLDFPSCGSAFKRPEGYFAGALIEQCGLKGFSIGGAKVSEKHAGFIINSGNATATDVIKLLKTVSDIVFAKTGVRLEPEIRVID